MKPLLKYAITVLLFFLLYHAYGLRAECPAGIPAGDDETVKFLRDAEANSVSVQCVRTLYTMIAQLPTNKKISIYIRLLSAHIPAEPAMGVTVNTPIRDESFFYPALAGLMDNISIADPLLLSYISRNSENDQIAWENAIYAYMSFRPGRANIFETILALKKERTAQIADKRASANLTAAIAFIDDHYCRPYRSEQCHVDAISP